MAKKKSPLTPKGQFARSQALSDARLRKAVKGEVDEIRPVEALNELRARGVPRLSALLIDVATKSHDIDLRATAAQALGKDTAAKHRAALLRMLDDGEPEVVRRAAESLGRIGGEAELERLCTLRPRKSIVKRAVDTAKTLLSYRTGSGRVRLSVPEGTELLVLGNAKAREIEVKRVGEKALDGLSAHLKRALPALPLADTAHVIDCGKAQFLLVLHKDLGRRKQLEVVAKKSSVAGALLRRAEVDGTYYLDGYLLTNPGRSGSVLVFVMRTSGQISHYGQLTLSDERASFTVSALNTRHTKPIVFEGSLGYKDLEIIMERAQVALEKSPMQPTPKLPRKLRITLP